MIARLLPILATVLAATAILTVTARRPSQPLLRATAGGDMQLENSRDGQAVLSTTGLRPGGSAEGTLTLTSRAPRAQRLTLSMNSLTDTPGPGGGLLSRHLDLRIERGAGAVVFAGKLADLPALDLGDLAPGSPTPFRFVVSLPEAGPAVDDAYAGARVTVSFQWRGDVLDEGQPQPQPPVTPEQDAPDGPAPVAPSERGDAPPPAPDVNELEGAAPVGPRTVRLWLGGRTTQRLGSRGRYGVLARCRPVCSVEATAIVRGRGGRVARAAARRVAVGSRAVSLEFRASRRLRAALQAGPVSVRIRLVARAPGHEPVVKIRTLRLRP